MEIGKRKQPKIALKIVLENDNVNFQLQILCDFMHLLLCYVRKCMWNPAHLIFKCLWLRIIY